MWLQVSVDVGLHVGEKRRRQTTTKKVPTGGRCSPGYVFSVSSIIPGLSTTCPGWVSRTSGSENEVKGEKANGSKRKPKTTKTCVIRLSCSTRGQSTRLNHTVGLSLLFPLALAFTSG